MGQTTKEQECLLHLASGIDELRELMFPGLRPRHSERNGACGILGLDNRAIYETIPKNKTKPLGDGDGRGEI